MYDYIRMCKQEDHRNVTKPVVWKNWFMQITRISTQCYDKIFFLSLQKYTIYLFT